MCWLRLRTVALLGALIGLRTVAAAPLDLAIPAPPVFGSNCAVCHGGDAQGTDRAPALLNSRRLRGQSEADIEATIRDGRGNMPSFAFLPAEQLETAARYVRSLNADAFGVKPSGDVAAGVRLLLRPWSAALNATWFAVEGGRMDPIFPMLAMP